MHIYWLITITQNVKKHDSGIYSLFLQLWVKSVAMWKFPEIRRGYCVGIKDWTFRLGVSEVGAVYLTLLFYY